MKVLSVQQPNATFICAGIKTVENRSWKTDYRGRIAIHASGDDYAWPDADFLPDSFIDRCQPWIGADDITDMPDDLIRYHNLVLDAFKFYGKSFDYNDDLTWLKQATKEKGFFLKAKAVVGEVEIVDIARGHDDEFADGNLYNWILSKPIIYEKPIWPVAGKVRLWTLDGI